jgi:hypothetical protein
MKFKHLRISALITFSFLLLSSCEKEAVNGPHHASGNDLDLSSKVIQLSCGQELKTDLYLGKTVMAGQVIVTPAGDGTLKVTYEMLPGYYLAETHLSVTNLLEQVPQSSDHNPKVGLFGYSTIHEPAVTTYVYDNIPEGKYILAHAMIKQFTGYQTDFQALDELLPATMKISVEYPFPGSPSYFQTTVTEGGDLDGVYEGWCIDVDHVIYQNTPYSVQVYSSYNPEILNGGFVDYPENLDKVNWVLNQEYVGTTAPGLGVITYGDVQRAIWQLLEANPSSSGLGSWSQERVDYIIAAAAAGEGFVPVCGNFVALILRPFDTNLPVQITVAKVALNLDLVCLPVYSEPETAWASGYDFGGSNWARYFVFCY